MQHHLDLGDPDARISSDQNDNLQKNMFLQLTEIHITQPYWIQSYKIHYAEQSKVMMDTVHSGLTNQAPSQAPSLFLLAIWYCSLDGRLRHQW